MRRGWDRRSAGDARRHGVGQGWFGPSGEERNLLTCRQKTHTILGSRSQRGLTQLALDVIFRSLGQNIVNPDSTPTLEQSIAASDPSEAAMFAASTFLDSVYADTAPLRASSRAPTPMIVGSISFLPQLRRQEQDRDSVGARRSPGHRSVRFVSREDSVAPSAPSWALSQHADQADCGSALSHSIAQPRDLARTLRPQRALDGVKHFMTTTVSIRSKTSTKPLHSQGDPAQTPSRRLHRPSAFPQQPDVSALSISCDPSSEYAVVISMYEVYNDRIFDLLSPPIKSAATKEYRRRPLLFKSTEASPDRKLVAGLRKVVCGSMQQALMVLEAGLHERRVAGTGSNSVSSRSHGFFCVEIKKRANGSRRNGTEMAWSGSTLTVVDLAGSERARDAKTAGVTLAEAGKINESLMYLGQCLQMQSDAASKDKVGPTIQWAEQGFDTDHG